MTNPQDTKEAQVENTEATYDDVQAAAEAATEDFTSTIGDALVDETAEVEGDETVAAEPAVLDRPIQTVGRRKRAIARVNVTAGTGKITCNGRDIEDYFPYKLHQQEIKDPLVLLERENQFDIAANINGGGPSGQAGAIRHGISRALLEVDADFRQALKKAGFLTRDPREKERRKYGLKKARKASQFSKR